VRITTRKPQDVARDVERLARAGHRHFVIVAISHGGMLDQERLGAARYAAGVHSAVELEDPTPAPSAASR
jgi:hypothetical protein